MSLGVLTMLEKLLLLQLWYRAELNGSVKVSSKKLSTNSPKLSPWTHNTQTLGNADLKHTPSLEGPNRQKTTAGTYKD